VYTVSDFDSNSDEDMKSCGNNQILQNVKSSFTLLKLKYRMRNITAANFPRNELTLCLIFCVVQLIPTCPYQNSTRYSQYSHRASYRTAF